MVLLTIGHLGVIENLFIMRYLVLDGMLGGTGAREKYESGYLNLQSLLLSESLIMDIQEWQSEYEQAKYSGYSDGAVINNLDERGLELAALLKKEMSEIKVEYYSDGILKRWIVD